MSKTVSPPAQTAAGTDLHRHGWSVESRHPTSAGHIVYVHCRACGKRRVDVQEHEELPPVALSNEVNPPAT